MQHLDNSVRTLPAISWWALYRCYAASRGTDHG